MLILRARTAISDGEGKLQFAQPQWTERVTSTNSALMERIEAGHSVPAGYVLAADEQTAGRGRGDRSWRTQPGRDVACSFVLRSTVEPRLLGSLSMAVALGVAGCLDRHGITARTKWPNDVVVEGRKIAGILPELGSMGGWKGPRSVVVGVGLNVGLSAAEAAQIDQPATSVFIEKGAAPSPRELLPELLQQIAPWIERWERGGFEALRQDWLQCCAGLGQPVTIVDGDHRRSGTLAGFGADGQLQLDEGAAIRDVWAGHLLLTPD